jgi:hypothetical protein
MAMDAFVPLTTDGGRGNDRTGAKPSGRTARPARPMLRSVVRTAAEVAAQPVRWLWKNQLAPENVATTMTGDKINEKRTEVPKFRFSRNNRGVNLSNEVKNRIDGGENGTLELCPRRRGKFQSSLEVRVSDPGIPLPQATDAAGHSCLFFITALGLRISGLKKEVRVPPVVLPLKLRAPRLQG